MQFFLVPAVILCGWCVCSRPADGAFDWKADVSVPWGVSELLVENRLKEAAFWPVAWATKEHRKAVGDKWHGMDKCGRMVFEDVRGV